MIERPKFQIIRHKAADYDLKVTYDTEGQISNMGGGREKLDILLRLKSKNYRLTLSPENTPSNLIGIFYRLDIVFICFRQTNGFQIDLKKGTILLKGVIEIMGQKIQKLCLIQLKQYHPNDYEQMLEKIQELQLQVIDLKQKQQESIEEIRKSYQKKFEQTEKAYTEALFSKQAQLKRVIQKQKHLQIYLKSLTKKIQEISEKAKWFSESNLKQLSEIKDKNDKLYQQLDSVYEQLESTKNHRSERNGRKRVKRTIQKKDEQENSNEGRQRRNWVSRNSHLVTHRNEERIENESDIDEQQIKNPGLPPDQNKIICKDSPDFQNFRTEGNQIICSKQNFKQRSIVFLNQNLPFYQYHFTLKIVKNEGTIEIGIGDKVDLTRNKYSSRQAYYSSKQYLSSQNKIQGSGFKSGDKVHVIVDLARLYIQFRINEKESIGHKLHALFGEKQLNVAPFVTMERAGDSVIWLDKQRY